jgi:hypothetical protein
MPDMSPRRRKIIWLLSSADDAGQLVRVSCRSHDGGCYYEPTDLVQIFGDVDVNQLDRAMKCERCGQRDNIDVDVRLPSGMELDKIKVRRLVEIKIYKRPVWREQQ